jgi:hypothetical protein
VALVGGSMGQILLTPLLGFFPEFPKDPPGISLSFWLWPGDSSGYSGRRASGLLPRGLGHYWIIVEMDTT